MTTTPTRSAAPPQVAPNAWTAWLLATALALGALTLNPSPAHAGVIGEAAEEFAKKATDDPVAQKEIGEATETFLESLPDARELAKEGIGAKGGPRQVSGPFQELVVNFDKLACAAWIVSFRDNLLGLMLKRDPETPPETLRAAQNLLNKVVFACRKVIDPDTNYDVVGGGGGAGAGTTPAGTTGPGVDVVDGQLVVSASDWACWNRCRDKYAEWKGAEGLRARAEETMRRNRRTADGLEQGQLPQMERDLRDAEWRLGRIEARKPKWPKTDPALDRESTQLSQEVDRMRADVAKMRAEVTRLRQEADALQARLAGLREAEQAALKAYLDCMKACADQARAANSPSTFADRTVEVLTPRLQVSSLPPRARFVPEETAEARTAMAMAISQLRTGAANVSGTEVSLAMPFGRDLGSQTRADAGAAMERARSDRSEYGQHEAPPASPAGSDTVAAMPEPVYAAPPAEVAQDAAPSQEFIQFQPPVQAQSSGSFHCPDHPGMGPHSH